MTETNATYDHFANGSGTGSSYTLLCASDVAVIPLTYLWRDEKGGLLPLACFTLLGGRRGIGKSLFWCWLVARITKGTLLGRWHGTPKDVLIALPEDSQSTVVTRLVAAGADLDRVRFVLGPQGEQPGVDAILDAVAEQKPVLAVLDATNSLVASARVDSHRETEIRSVLVPLLDVAATTGTALLGLVHFKKGRVEGDLLDMINGSGGYANVPRCVLGMAELEDGTRVVAVAKANDGPVDRPGVVFALDVVQATFPDGRLMAEEDGTRVMVARLRHEGLTEGSGEDAVRDALGEDLEDSDSRAERDEMVEFIRGLVKDGAVVAAVDGEKALKEAGFSTAKATMHRARRRAGVVSRKPAMASGWVWQAKEGFASRGDTPEGGTSAAEAPKNRMDSEKYEGSGSRETPPARGRVEPPLADAAPGTYRPSPDGSAFDQARASSNGQQPCGHPNLDLDLDGRTCLRCP